MPTLPDRGTAHPLLAHHYARLGDMGEALSVLEQCIPLDEGFDLDGDPAFGPFKRAPEFKKLVGVHSRDS
jgi:hypothetical protein